jgi:hypothetical protein
MKKIISNFNKFQYHKYLKSNFSLSQNKNFSKTPRHHPVLTEYYLNDELIKLDDKSYYSKVIVSLLEKEFDGQCEIQKKINEITSFNNNNNNTKEIYIENLKYSQEDLDKNYKEKKLNSNYIHNIFLLNEEYILLNSLLNKIIFNGSIPKSEDLEKYIDIKSKIDILVNEFFNGAILTKEEESKKLIYLIEKYKKFRYYKEHNLKEYKCIFTERDYINYLPICFSQHIHINKSIHLTPNKFQIGYNKNLKPFDVDSIFQVNDFIKKNTPYSIMRFLYLFIKNKHLMNNVVKSELIAYCLLAKINFFLLTEEFNKQFDCQFDFYIGNAILSMHIWLICQRLNNFKRSKNASELVQNILKLNKSICNSQFQSVDTLRRISKFNKIEENAEEQKQKLHWHFNIYDCTVEDNFYKIDALVWTYIFREKIDRYDNRVYKMSHYLVYHFNKFKDLTYEDIKNMNFEFDLEKSIPINYKDFIETINPKLSEEQLFLENYHNFTYRSYVYSYKNEMERGFNNLYKTFIRYTGDQSFDKNNMLTMSRRQIDDGYDSLKDQEKSKELQSSLNIDTNSSSIAFFRNLFNIWSNKYFNKINETCEKEDRIREMGNYIDLRKIEGVKRFSENLDLKMRKKLYTYRYNLENNKKATKDIFILHETKLFYPDANMINKKRRDKNLVEKMFRL